MAAAISAGVRIVVGFWGEDPSRLSQLRESLGDVAGVELPTSLAQAIELLAGRAMLRPLGAQAGAMAS